MRCAASNAANSFVIAQLRAQPIINTALTYDYTPGGQDSIDAAVVDAVDLTGQESGTAYLPGHPIVWQELGETSIPGSESGIKPRLVSVPGACVHVHLQGRCPTNPGTVCST